MPYVKILTLAICLVFVGNTYGSQPRLSKSSLSGLLQQPTVSAIFRDRTGILWIGTQQGLHRFDGANLTIYDSAKSNQNWIPDSVIMHIAEDSDGNLLVGTAGGFLLKMNSHSEIFDAFKLPGPEGKTSLIKFLVSRSGDIWVLSKDGLDVFDSQFQQTQNWIVSFRTQYKLGRLHDILEDESGQVWIGGSLGLAKIMPKSRAIVSFDNTIMRLHNKSSLTTLAIGQPGRLIVGTDTGHIVIWDIEAGNTVADLAIAQNTSRYITALKVYGDILIVATDGGLYASDINLSYTEDWGDKGEGLSNPDVYSLLSDGEYIWVGTLHGLDLLSFASFELFDTKNSGVSNTILSFAEDSDGRIYIGTYSGLYTYDDISRSHTQFAIGSDSSSHTFGHQGVAAIASRDEKLWLGFFKNGVGTVDVLTSEIRFHDLGVANTIGITKIVPGNKSGNIWIATYDHGLFRVDGDKTISYFKNDTLPEKVITLMSPSKIGLIAISENRVYAHEADIDFFRQIRFDYGYEGKRPQIYSITQDHNDNIMIGTKDYGLFSWSRENQMKDDFTLESVAETDLATSTIYAIEIDSNGNLWCSTQNGIVKVSRKWQLIKRFTNSDGLQGNDFGLGASFTSSKGLIYFGGANGYNRFDPDEVPVDSPQSPMILTKISLPKQEIRILDALAEIETLQLSHTDHFVTFQFSVLDFVSLEKNQFRYKLENFDTNWVENGTQNTATYTNLPAGEYVLRVQGANSAGIWNREGITLRVRVLPAPWLSWWAYSIYVMGLLFLLWSSQRIYRSYAIDRKSTQMAVEMFEAANRADDEMQEQLELQDAVIQSAFQHQVTTLSLVSEFISHRGSKESNDQIRDLTESGIKRIAALSMLEDCVYYEGGVSVVDLHKYTENVLPLLLKSASVPPETIITINEFTSILLPTEIATPLSIVIYELLENCVQHAFELESAANYIHLKLSFSNDSNLPLSSLELTIQDSGIGLPDTIANLTLENSGIGIVQNILQKMGGMMKCSIEKGTTISITLPQPKASYKYSDQPNPA